MKKIHGLTIVVAMTGAMAFAQANEAQTGEAQAGEANLPRFRAQASGFGRHGIKAAGERGALYGADIDLYFTAWRIPQFNWWVGIGGGWAPEREFFSDSSFVTYGDADGLGIGTCLDVNRARDLKMGYGELRLMTVPEWNITGWLSVGLRLGAAFDFVSVKGRNFEDRTIRFVPYLGPNIYNIVRDDSYDTDKMVVAGIVGLQATVMPWDNFGLYGSVDARLGGDVDLGADEKVEMNSLQWNAGLVLQF